MNKCKHDKDGYCEICSDDTVKQPCCEGPCFESEIDEACQEEPDAHSCRAEADAYGVCQYCGALVYMSPAYCDAYGCEPPETLDDSDVYNDEY